MKNSIVAVAVLMASAGAVAAPPADGTRSGEQDAASASAATGGTTGAAEQQQDDQKKICRTERATGSLTRRTRVCMTAAQWREVNARTYRGVSEMQGQASGGQVVQNNTGAP